MILTLVEGKRVPSLRNMAGLLAERGLAASYVTIRTDYKALGLVTERPKPAENLSLLPAA